MIVIQGEQYPVQFYIIDGREVIDPSTIQDLILTIGYEKEIVKKYSDNDIEYDSDGQFYFFKLLAEETENLTPTSYPIQLKLKDTNDNIYIMKAEDVIIMKSINKEE